MPDEALRILWKSALKLYINILSCKTKTIYVIRTIQKYSKEKISKRSNIESDAYPAQISRGELKPCIISTLARIRYPSCPHVPTLAAIAALCP